MRTRSKARINFQFRHIPRGATVDHPKASSPNGILGLATSLRSPPCCVGSKRVIRIAGIHKIGTGGTQ
jgi:hypothetical protein